MAGTFHSPGEGENFGGEAMSISIKATGEQTDGRLFFQEGVLEAGMGGPPLHVHHKMHDMFYVLEGTLTVQLGDEVIDAKPGSFVCAPPGTPHTFTNRSGAQVRMLNFSTPSGWEGYMRELMELSAEHQGQPPPEKLGEVLSRYDFEAVGPPIGA